MAKVLGIGSPKGGVGKSTEAVTLAAIAAKVWNLQVLLVDADDGTHTSSGWTKRGDADVFPFDVAVTDGDLSRLPDLKQAEKWDLVIVDMPGTKQGAWETMLTGSDEKPIPDLLLLPSKEELGDLRPTVSSIEAEILPLNAPYLLALLPIYWYAMDQATERREGLIKRGLNVAETIIQRRQVYVDAFEANRSVLSMPGARSTAREAEKDQLALAREVFERLGFKTPAGQRRP